MFKDAVGGSEGIVSFDEDASEPDPQSVYQGQVRPMNESNGYTYLNDRERSCLLVRLLLSPILDL